LTRFGFLGFKVSIQKGNWNKKLYLLYDYIYIYLFWGDYMYKTLLSNVIFALLIGLVYIFFNGVSVNVIYLVILFFVLLLIRDFVIDLIKKKKHE